MPQKHVLAARRATAQRFAGAAARLSGWRCQARLQLTLPVSLLPAARWENSVYRLAVPASFAPPLPARDRNSDGQSGALSGINTRFSIRNRESMTHVSYSF